MRCFEIEETIKFKGVSKQLNNNMRCFEMMISSIGDSGKKTVKQ